MSGRWACVIGNPARHSLSPALHNAAFAALGMDAHYTVREVDDAGLPAVLDALADPACLGANVTAPHKRTVIPRMAELSPEAQAMGAVNTIVQRDGVLHGDNTDALGFLNWLQELNVDLAEISVLLLGAGGAARAVVVALARGGARHVTIANRTTARGAELVQDLGPQVPGLTMVPAPLDIAAKPAPTPVPLVINATSLGHQGTAPVVHPSWYAPASFGIELVYNPPETPFMRAARDAGARAENGLGMLIHQAVRGFELWTGVKPPLDVYKRAAARELEVRAQSAEVLR